jgi:hypothetical protein
VYKVLLTRGMVGTLLYSPDEETGAKLRELVTWQRCRAPHNPVVDVPRSLRV